MTRFPLKSTLALLGLGLALAASPARADLSVFTNASTGFDVSGNGQFAVLGSSGSSGGSEVFLWSAATNSITGIGGFTGSSGKVLISGDGSTIAASGKDANNNRVSAIYSVGTGIWTLVPGLGSASGGVAGSSYALSGDGRYVGGSSYKTSAGAGSHGFVYDTVTSTLTEVSTTQSRITGISSGAQTLVGATGSGQNGALWTRNGDGTYTQTTLLNPDAPASKLSLVSSGLSDNGLWAAGASFNTANPYRVNATTGQVQFFDKLGFAANGNSVATPAAISADGNTIVGIHMPSGALLSDSYGFIWKADGTVNGNTLGGTVMSFDDYLAGYGIDLDNHYNFVSIIGMSNDASVFSGIAKDNLTGGQVAFVVSVPVPEPSQYVMLAWGLTLLVGVVRRRRKALSA